jgi:hypothetical protein
MRTLADERGSEEAAVAARVIAWAKERKLRLDWGRGKIYGSFFPVVDHGGDWYAPVSLGTSGTVEVQFHYFASKPPLDAEETRKEFAQRLNSISGVNIPLDAINRRPSFPLAALTEDAALRAFLDTLDWFFAEVRSVPVAAQVSP